MSPLPQRKKSAEELAKLRESLGIPGATAESPPPAPAPGPDPEPAPAPPPPKPVRSLKKSEHLPSSNPQSAIRNPQSSTLPSRKHSQRDLDEIRRREAFSIQSPAIHLQTLTARPALLAGLYLLAAATVICAVLRSDIVIVLICGLLTLGASGFIFVKKKRSIHHAAFAAAIAFFTLVFSVLHHFPQLRHA